LLVDTLVVFATDRNNRPKIKEETLLLIERSIHHHLVRFFVNQVNVMFFSDRSVCKSKYTKYGWTNMYKNCIKQNKPTNHHAMDVCTPIKQWWRLPLYYVENRKSETIRVQQVQEIG